jgi:cysteine desulfurase
VSVQTIEEFGKIIKEKQSNTLFHVDAVQAFGKYQINPSEDEN